MKFLYFLKRIEQNSLWPPFFPPAEGFRFYKHPTLRSEFNSVTSVGGTFLFLNDPSVQEEKVPDHNLSTSSVRCPLLSHCANVILNLIKNVCRRLLVGQKEPNVLLRE